MSDQSYHAEVLRVFREAGEPLSTRALAYRCIDAGVFPSDWLESAAIRAVQVECRDALKTSDIRGLPFAGKTAELDSDGSPVWAQREFWDYETYALNIAEHVGQARSNLDKASILADECREKYGRAPSLPLMVGEAVRRCCRLMSTSLNIYEQAARVSKARQIADRIWSDLPAADRLDPSTPDALAGATTEQRDAFARAAAQNPPSLATWAAVVADIASRVQVERRRAERAKEDPFDGLTGEDIDRGRRDYERDLARILR